LTYTITAQDGTTKANITVDVRIESPTLAEQGYFSALLSDCEIGYALNADGTITVYLRIPFLDNADPAKIDAILAIFSGLMYSNVSYAYVGNIIPITARSARSASVKTPCLQIKFTAQSLDALKKGVLDKINYWLKGYTTEYVQTYTGGLKFSDVKMTDETPAGGNDTGNSGGGGGGCDAGSGMFGLLLLAGFVTCKFRFTRSSSPK
jgi:hypothetical protein